MITRNRQQIVRRCALTLLLAGALMLQPPMTGHAAAGKGKTASEHKNTAATKASATKASATKASATKASATKTSTAKTAAVPTAAVSLLPQEQAAAAEQGLFTVLNNDRTRIIDYGASETDTGVRYLSMAGGQESASIWNVTFTLPAGQKADGTATAAVSLTFKDAMAGRTLREGESLQAFYDTGSGVYYKVPTAVTQDGVTMTLPMLTASDHQYLILVITSGFWRPGSGYDYLAIGNSITLHPRQGYWPDAMGMGATSIEKDYYHLVASGLSAEASQKGQGFQSAALNYAIWEICSGKRESVLYLLDPYLSEELELVSIQLGENAIPDPAGFAEDFPKLIEYIHKKAPNAKLVIVGNFWNCDVQTAVKLQCAEGSGRSYADLSDISVQPYVTTSASPYVFGNELACDANGTAHTCGKEAVSCHPNNAGMQVIARRILQAVSQ